MKKLSLLAAIFSACSVAFVSNAEVRSVTSNADSGEGSLRDVWHASASGDVIEIQEGLEILLNSVISVTNKTLTVKGLGSGAKVNGQGKTGLFFLRSSWGQKPVLRFENITFTNGYSKTGGAIPSDGGGTQGSNTYEFDNCKFLGNEATSCGGVIGNGGTWVINECLFRGNHAPYGGVFNDCAYTLFATNSVFEGNWAEKKGGVWGSSSNYPGASGNWVLYGCDFIANSVTNGSGGITCKPWANLLATNCKFNGNFVTSGSPVFGAASAQTATSVFDGCEFCDNETTGEAAVFQILCSHSSTMGDDDSWVMVRNSKITGNSAARITVAGSSSICITFENCLINDNVATTSGGWYSCGMFGGNFSGAQAGRHFSLSLTNCVVRNNANLGGDSSIFWLYSVGTGSCMRAYGTLFEGNYASSGAALVSSSGFMLGFDRCTFKDNGVAPDGSTTNTTLFSVGDRDADTVIRNCTFVGNWGKGTAHQKYGLVDVTSAHPVMFEHCTFMSNNMLKVTNSKPSVLCNRGGADVRMSNCAFADNLNTAAEDCPVSETTAGSTLMANCKLTGTTNVSRLTDVTQSVPFEDFKFIEFGANGNRNVLYGTEVLPTVAIAKDSVLRNAGVSSLAVDARGFPRDSHPDIGAYEFIVKSGLRLLLR